MYRKLGLIFICLFLAVCLCPAVCAQQSMEITVTGEGYSDTAFLTDDNTEKYMISSGQCTLIVTSESTDIGSLYLMFDLPCGQYTVTDNTNSKSYTAGTYGYLHEYIELDTPSASITLQFPAEVSLSEIQAFRYGADPEGIQVWQPPLEGDTDLMLMSTHGDDEHLFFGGILPMYAGEFGYKVQVVYLTDHRNLTNRRTHEMLNGLWAVGVRNYPVFGSFADFRIDSLEKTYDRYENLGTTRDDLMDYVVTQIRRFRPQVIVGHDFEGEYGHGMHMVYADLLAEAVTVTADSTAFPASAETYGTWDVPKTYIHLYQENPVVIDMDVPLSRFGGMSAFDVSRYAGFPCHESQVTSTSFADWVYGYNREISSVWEIAEYNPCYYGLYRSTVGPDILKNDFMENTQNSLVRKQQEEEPEETQPTQAATEVGQFNEPAEEKPSNNSLSLICVGVAVLGILALVLLLRRR